jgi:hypothetical protein
MTGGLNEEAVRILTWVVYALMLILTVATSYLIVQNSTLPKRYVRLERYQADTHRVEATTHRIEVKFDKFSERMNGKIDLLIREGANRRDR